MTKKVSAEEAIEKKIDRILNAKATVRIRTELTRGVPGSLIVDQIKGSLIFLSPLVILIGLVLSNRIAGPIYHIQRFLRRASTGYYEDRLKLREKDELQDIARSINHLVSKLQSEQARRREKLDEVRGLTDELEAALIAGEQDKEKLLTKMMRLKEDLNKLQQI